ncbi:MAG: Rieske 2Fe-2S domain-containing protein [Chloroflexi bacterium]|nr:Rieske 2Fe-2S domain-containing protein [Chloroflexota bacterium]
MIRPHDETATSAGGLLAKLKRRQLLRLGFLGGTTLALTEFTAILLPFLHVQKLTGLGAKVQVGSKESVLAKFRSTNDTPILNIEGRFFLLHAPNGIIAAYRKCTHLGCTVPWVPSQDMFQCPCHGSQFHKKTGVVLGGPAPKPLQLFHMSDTGSTLIVDTNPLNLIDRPSNEFNSADVEVKV